MPDQSTLGTRTLTACFHIIATIRLIRPRVNGELQGVTRGYRRLRGVKRAYKGLQGVTRGYRKLKRVIVGYKR